MADIAPTHWSRADQLLVTSMRLLACPCGQSNLDLTRPESPAVQLNKLLATLDRHARRIFYFGQLPQTSLSTDELAIHQLVAAAQQQQVSEMRLRVRWLSRQPGQSRVCRAATDVAAMLLVEGYELTHFPQAMAHRIPGSTSLAANASRAAAACEGDNVLTPVFCSV